MKRQQKSAIRFASCFAFIAAICGAGFYTSAASAQVTTVYADGTGAHEIAISIPVTATVGGKCGFVGGDFAQTINLNDIDVSGTSGSVNFTLDCTVNSNVAVTSSNGALKLTGVPVVAGFDYSTDYDVTLNLKADNGTTATATCLASDLTATGACSFKGTAATAAGIGLALNAPSTAATTSGNNIVVRTTNHIGPNILYASNAYTDTLTITVAAQ